MRRLAICLTTTFCLGTAGTASADPLTEPQRLALSALELEFDAHGQTATRTELADAFSEACKAGYSLACQRGAWVVYGRADLESAADLFGSACDSSDPVACMVVGWHLDRSAPQTSDRDRQWRRAAKLFRDNCDEGFVPACYDYGLSLYLNKGFKADPRAGVSRWKKACDAEDWPSCTQLGSLSVEGARGVPRSSTQAEKYFEPACAGGFVEACFQSGLLAEDDWQTEERDHWFRTQCTAGHRESCWTLAQSYLSGAVQPPAGASVDELLGRGCDLGSAPACFEAGRVLMNEESPDFEAASGRFAKACELGEMSGCTSQVELITSDKVDGSVKTAPQAFETACLKRNSAPACTALALELMRGVDLARDPSRARALLHRSCSDASSDPLACHTLGLAYANGTGGERDRTTAAKYYRWACDGGNAESCEARGDLLTEGRGIRRDDQDALAMYTKACEADRPEACHNAAVILDDGTFVERDPAQAAILFQKACDGGSGDGCTGLGILLMEDSDAVAAREAFDRGIGLGSVDAMREQARMLWNGFGGSRKKRRARELAARACQEGDALACRGAEAI